MRQSEIELGAVPPTQLIKHAAVKSNQDSMERLIGAYDTLLDRFMPPSILVDEQWMVIDTFAGADRYLRLRSRRPTQSVMELVCDPIRLALAEAFERLCSGEHPVVMAPVDVPAEYSSDSPLRISVAAVPIDEAGPPFYSIAIEPYTRSVFSPARVSFATPTVVRENSYCEETQAGLTEIVARGRSEHHLDAFLESTRLPVVFLDRDLRISRFTAQAGRMFNLVPHDVGRELRTFAGVLEVPDLIDRIRAVIHTGDPDEVEIQLNRSTQYFIARVSPYCDGQAITGAVLTVIDLTRLGEEIQTTRWLSSIVQSTDDAIISRDRDNRIVSWNVGAEELYGYTADEVLGKDFQMLVPANHEMDHSQTLRALQKGGHFDHFETTRLGKGGRLVDVSVRLSPVYDEDRRVIGLSTIERDNSRQSEALNRLATSERKFQDFYHQSPDIYCSVDASNGMISECNDRMCERLGYDRSEIIGRLFIHLHSPQTQLLASNCFEQFRAQGEVRDQDLELICRDGSTIPVSLNMTAIRDQDGRIVRSRSVWRDMSTQRIKEELQRQTELRYRNSFQNSAIGIAQLTPEGRYLIANRRFCEMLGYTTEELKQFTFADLTHPDDLALEAHKRAELLAGKCETYVIEKRYLHKHGHELWVSLFVSLERGRDGEPVACHSYVEDITGRKELESELRLAIAQRDQFLAMLSHELRNPLGAILNTCAVLNRGRELPKIMQQPVSIVTRQARQMAELLDDLLDVSRITSGKIKLEKTRTLLSEIVDEAVESQQGLAAERQQRLVVTYADEPLHVFGDRSRLVQVVVNLLNNAIKYSGDGGVIKVTLEKRGRNGVIRVQDSGVGIEPELIESLFEMFAQKDSTLDRSGGGMGLGLHLVRRLVEFHSGRVTGRSEGVGKGSEFEVELPLSTRSPKNSAPKLSRPPANPSRPIHKIVVVEDIADARQMLVALLQADDYEVLSAADGEAGLELILKERPDAAILDIGLPKLDGYEVARRIRQHYKKGEMVLVALSGYGQDSDHDRAIEAGFDQLLVKPLNQARLEMILRK